MQSILGVVTIVQEGRFQLLDDNGVAHHFDLHHSAPLEPDQLPAVLGRRVSVSYVAAPDTICHAAKQISLLEA